MKKILYILLLMYSFFLCSNVYAANTFKKNVNFRLDESVEFDWFHSINEFGNSFLVITYNSDDYTLGLYDFNGNLIKSKKLDEIGTFWGLDSVYFHDGNVYILVYNQKDVILKLNNDLELVDTITISGVDGGGEPLYSHWHGNETAWFKDETFAIPLYDWLVSVKLDFSGYELINYTATSTQEHLTHYYDLLYYGYFGEVADDELQFSIDVPLESFDLSDDNKVILASGAFNQCTMPGNYIELEECGDEVPVVTFIDNVNKKVLWNKTYKEYDYISNVEIVNDYLVFVGYYDDSTSDILIADRNGNIIQKIEKDAVYHSVNSIAHGFIGVTIVDKEVTISSYYFPLSVSTNIISGKGKVEIIGGDKMGEVITVKATPDAGYVLEEIIVTDSEGQLIELNDNEFRLAIGGATVTTKFAVKNPVTVDISKTMLTILFAIMFILPFVINKIIKRKEELL